MRERARDKGRLEDIIEYSNNVTSLIEGYSLEALIADKRTYYSVMKNIEVVGEAAYMLTKAFKKLHPEYLDYSDLEGSLERSTDDKPVVYFKDGVTEIWLTSGNSNGIMAVILSFTDIRLQDLKIN